MLLEIGIGVVGFVGGLIVGALANRGEKTKAAQLQADKEYLGRKLDEANTWIRNKFGNDPSAPKP